jgi:hypothetical protein
VAFTGHGLIASDGIAWRGDSMGWGVNGVRKKLVADFICVVCFQVHIGHARALGRKSIICGSEGAKGRDIGRHGCERHRRILIFICITMYQQAKGAKPN